jgi:hypothetical protein
VRRNSEDTAVDGDELRLKLLTAMRDRTVSDPGNRMFDSAEWAQQEGLDAQQVERATRWAKDRGYISSAGWGPYWRLDPAGEDLVEDEKRRSTVAEREDQRERFLDLVYSATDGGQSLDGPSGVEIASAVGITDHGPALGFMRSLVDRGLVEMPSLADDVLLTPAGVADVEERARRARPPALAVVLLTPADRAALESLLTDVRRLLDDPDEVPPSEAAELLEQDLNDAAGYLREDTATAREASWIARALRTGLQAATAGVIGNRADEVIRQLWQFAQHLG